VQPTTIDDHSSDGSFESSPGSKRNRGTREEDVGDYGDVVAWMFFRRQ